MRSSPPASPALATAGFSLLEVLAALMVLGVLLSVALPVFPQEHRAVQRAAARAAALHKAQSLLTASLAGYHATNSATSPAQDSSIKTRILQQNERWILLQITVSIPLPHDSPVTLHRLLLQTAGTLAKDG